MVSVSHSHLGGLGPGISMYESLSRRRSRQLEAGDANEEHVTPFLPVTLPLS